MNRFKTLLRGPGFLAALATIVLLRLVTLGAPDLVDSTEGRYASVAKLMLDRGDWVTPWINFKGEEKPYLGKPPLHFWLMESSYLLLGPSNFSARLPGVLSAVGIGAVIWILCAILLSIEAAYIATIVLASSCGLFFLAGTVVLDVTLSLGITIATASFLLADRSRVAGYLFFAGLGLGVLVKGPLACVLTFVTIIPWAIAQKVRSKAWPTQIKKLPWLPGILLFAAIALPWYLWAELRNPGFLRYFLWNENFGRYMRNDYGDEYGTGHQQVFGAAWAFMLPALFPWSLIVLGLLIAARKSIAKRSTISDILKDPLLMYALAWTASCPVLLLAAKQYTATYITSSLPGFAFLVGVLWERQRNKQWVSNRALTTALQLTCGLFGLILIVGGIVSTHYRAGSVASTAAVAVGLATLLASRSAYRFENSASAIARVGALSGITFTFVVLCYGNHISLQRSTRRALEAARSLSPQQNPLKVGFPLYFPFSSTFYGSLTKGGPVKAVPVPDATRPPPDVEVLLVHERNVTRFRELAPEIQLVGEVGGWKIFRAR